MKCKCFIMEKKNEKHTMSKENKNELLVLHSATLILPL